jgi:hypothetical protein
VSLSLKTSLKNQEYKFDTEPPETVSLHVAIGGGSEDVVDLNKGPCVEPA